ncbi:MAG: YdeI/OmpD-associated family protein [Treponema sp.]|jgi:uncharacterized protein YdeI (YjbR/CyaY-like superfamily)|nr:YdeI/OmpD-associated family protein [Treponema sp.]
METLLKVKTRQELRDWLMKHSITAKEAWVFSVIKPAPGKLLYLEIVEEALCFGWIDSTKKVIEEGNIQRITPRKKNSNWTELNKERVRRLEKLGLMTDMGRSCLPDMSPQSFTIHPEIISALQSEAEVWKNYLELPELYRRIRIDTIQSCLKIKDTDLYTKRLQKFIDSTRQGKMYGAWNDDGQL